MGSFHGRLPGGCGENFSSWRVSHVRTEERNENGVSFLRFHTEGEPGQFMIGSFPVKVPQVFRLRVKCRAAEPLALAIRQIGSPYRTYWSGEANSPDWQEKEFVFVIRDAAKDAAALFFWTPAGTMDIASLSLSLTDDSAIAEMVRRPPADLHQFLRHTRFPYGLPNAWNVDRDCFSGSCGTDPEVRAPDGTPVLKLASATPLVVWSEPFQTNDPKKPLHVTIRYRAEGAWRTVIVQGNRHHVSALDLPPAVEWSTRTVSFNAPPLAESFALRFAGSGTLRLDAVTVCRNDAQGTTNVAEVALAPASGEIARQTRVLFADEPALIRAFLVKPLTGGARLRAFGVNLYGERQELHVPPPANEGGREITLPFHCFPDTPLGQFRIEAFVERNGRRISPIEEMILTRVERPVAWGRDAPDSPFGCHFLPREETILTMKAGGINWARFHDACTELTGWAHLEPQKGTWRFRDEDIHRFRKHHIKIFAQLGTAPAWATHYGDLGCSQMGYFERYLRPTNTLDWATYVQTVVKRYDGVIDEYFAWNEPWGEWWKSAKDSRYYDKEKAGYDFGVFSRLTYAAVKRTNPNARIYGYNTYASKAGEIWTEEVDSAGAYDACDGIDFHFYTNAKRCHPGADVKVTEMPLRPIRKRHPEWNTKTKPVYMSEGQGASSGSGGGTSYLSGMYRASVPWEAESERESIRIADAQCRYTVSLLAEGVDKVYLYTAHSYTALAVKPAYLALLAGDGFPHPSYAAYANLARKIEGKRFVRMERLGKTGGSYLFSDNKTSCRVLADLSPDELQQLAKENHWRVTDLFGNPLTADHILPGTLVYAE